MRIANHGTGTVSIPRVTLYVGVTCLRANTIDSGRRHGQHATVRGVVGEIELASLGIGDRGRLVAGDKVGTG